MELILTDSIVWAIALAAVGIAGITTIPRIAMNRGDNYKQIKANFDKVAKSQDLYIEELEETMRHYKNKASNMERGPRIEGNIEELDTIMPNLVKEFAPFAPKWLKPFLGNEDMQKFIVDYATKHPDKVQGVVSKLIKKKGDKELESQPELQGL